MACLFQWRWVATNWRTRNSVFLKAHDSQGNDGSLYLPIQTANFCVTKDVTDDQAFSADYTWCMAENPRSHAMAH
jgi:hypothetical protein